MDERLCLFSRLWLIPLLGLLPMFSGTLLHKLSDFSLLFYHFPFPVGIKTCFSLCHLKKSFLNDTLFPAIILHYLNVVKTCLHSHFSSLAPTLYSTTSWILHNYYGQVGLCKDTNDLQGTNQTVIFQSSSWPLKSNWHFSLVPLRKYSLSLFSQIPHPLGFHLTFLCLLS